MNNEDPVRIEFFGDEIDTMRYFTIDTQRSIETIENCTITPLHLDMLGDDATTLLSYGNNGITIYDEPGRIQESLKKFLKEDPTHRGGSLRLEYYNAVLMDIHKLPLPLCNNDLLVSLDLIQWVFKARR